MRQIVTNVYTFAELSDSAKQKAIEHYRNLTLENGDIDLDHCVDAIAEAGKMLGIDFATRSVPLMNGKTRKVPAINYSISYSQGDGASFEGSYAYAKDASKAISKEFGGKFGADVAEIAQELLSLQKQANYKLCATICSYSGHHSHSGMMAVSVHRDDDKDVPKALAESMTDALRQFADVGYRMLVESYEASLSDEYLTETIEANEYEFDEHGNMA